MELTFYKYEALGNDFIVLNRLSGGADLSVAQVVALCDRHRGIGADGILSLWSSTVADGRMQIQNADGGEVDMCGNGLRCMARFVHAQALVPIQQDEVRLELAGRVCVCQRHADHSYGVQMGAISWSDDSLPSQASAGCLAIDIPELHQSFEGLALWIGNPHFCVFLPRGHSPRDYARRFGEAISTHSWFTQGVNVSFAVSIPGGFEAAVWERGVGMTQACGSAACAVVAAAVRQGIWQSQHNAEVLLPGGRLGITVDPAMQHILMQGPAKPVFVGQWSGFNI